MQKGKPPSRAEPAGTKFYTWALLLTFVFGLVQGNWWPIGLLFASPFVIWLAKYFFAGKKGSQWPSSQEG